MEWTALTTKMDAEIAAYYAFQNILFEEAKNGIHREDTTNPHSAKIDEILEELRAMKDANAKELENVSTESDDE